jgi:hypothetical protein
LGANRKWLADAQNSAFDPKQSFDRFGRVIEMAQVRGARRVEASSAEAPIPAAGVLIVLVLCGPNAAGAAPPAEGDLHGLGR